MLLRGTYLNSEAAQQGRPIYLCKGGCRFLVAPLLPYHILGDRPYVFLYSMMNHAFARASLYIFKITLPIFH